jgi:hypothetical protein
MIVQKLFFRLFAQLRIGLFSLFCGVIFRIVASI